MFSPRQHQRIDQPLTAERLPGAFFQFGIEECQIERRIMRNERRVAEEIEQLLDAVLNSA